MAAGKLEAAIAAAAMARERMSQAEIGQFKVYNFQRQFFAFLETAELREEEVPAERGEVVFYNLGKFSQVITDFETIHFRSDPTAKYSTFADFLQYRAEVAGRNSDARTTSTLPAASRCAGRLPASHGGERAAVSFEQPRTLGPYCATTRSHQPTTEFLPKAIIGRLGQFAPISDATKCSPVEVAGRYSAETKEFADLMGGGVGGGFLEGNSLYLFRNGLFVYIEWNDVAPPRGDGEGQLGTPPRHTDVGANPADALIC